MFGKLNHLAITSDHYTLLGMFYRAMFGLKASGDTAREIGAISVGDGYVGMTLIPRRGGRKAGLDHFGIEVEDLDKVRSKVAKKYPDIEIVKRPGNRPFASYSAHDPAGNYLTDGRMTMAIVPWKISSFNGAGIEQPGMDHIGFRVPDIKAFEANCDRIAKTNIQLAPKPIPFDAEGAARLKLLQKCPHGTVQLADPDGTLIDVAQDHP
jgi:catechol 2,3-dioxygenase-like lactoylglutathione lyase family enzyme